MLKTKLSLMDKCILNRLQTGIPLVKRPWKALSAQLLINENTLLKRIAFLKNKGIIRRVSAGFSPQRIGFASTLIAVKADEKDIKEAVKRINSYPEVTHNYKRDGDYNIWFTLVARDSKRIARIKDELAKYKKIKSLIELPAKKLFKIDVNLRA